MVQMQDFLDVSYYTILFYTVCRVLRRHLNKNNCCFSFFFLQGSISSDSGFSQDKDPDINLDKLRDYLRKVETTNLKAEAKLEVLRNGGSKTSYRTS